MLDVSRAAFTFCVPVRHIYMQTADYRNCPWFTVHKIVSPWFSHLKRRDHIRARHKAQTSRKVNIIIFCFFSLPTHSLQRCRTKKLIRDGFHSFIRVFSLTLSLSLWFASFPSSCFGRVYFSINFYYVFGEHRTRTRTTRRTDADKQCTAIQSEFYSFCIE